MKRLFTILAAVCMCCLMSCEKDGGQAKDEFGRSSEYAWSYLGKSRSTVENELKKAGWEQNYSGKTYAGSPVVLYVYNRPQGSGWGPCHFEKYAYDSQRSDTYSLNTLMQQGKMYGELYMIFRDGIVQDLGIFWMMPTPYDELDRYVNFSNRIYQAYTSDCGVDAQWKGKVNSVNYNDRQRFMSAIKNSNEPSLYEYGSDYQSNTECSYNIEARYDYYLNNTFYISYEGEKY